MPLAWAARHGAKGNMKKFNVKKGLEGEEAPAGILGESLTSKRL